jgi:hypothetical protein
MTWEEKLKELLDLPTNYGGFDTDNNVSDVLSREFAPALIAKYIEDKISKGDLSVKEEAELLKESLRKWSEVYSHCKRNPKCVKFEKGGNCWRYKDGLFAVGYIAFPEGLEGFWGKKLYYHRLSKHALQRALKHPRYNPAR